MKPALLHEDAEAELRAALDYYAEKRRGLEGEFLRAFESALRRVREIPWRAPLRMSPGCDSACFGGFRTR